MAHASVVVSSNPAHMIVGYTEGLQGEDHTCSKGHKSQLVVLCSLVEEAADDQSNQKMSSSGHHSGYKLVELQEGNEVEVQLLHAKSPDDISLKLNGK